MEDGKDDSTNHPDNKKFSGDGWTDLSNRKRRCTDCLCLILLLAAWAAMTGIGLVVCGVIEDSHLEPGNPARLIHAVDYDGRICGVSDGVHGRPNAYYMTSGAVVCVNDCPSETDFTAFICYDEDQTDADNSDSDAWQLVSEQKCMYEMQTKSILYRCIISEDNSTITDAAMDVANQYISVSTDSLFAYSAADSPNWISNFFSSLWLLRGYIFGFGIGVAVFFAFVYLYLLRIPGLLALIIWTILFSVLAFFCVASFLLWDLAKEWNQADSDRSNAEVQTMYIVSYIGFAVTGLYACLLLVMRKRIMLAIGIVKEAARALASMPALLFLPIVQAIGIVLFLVPWTIYVLYLASSGSNSTETTDAGTYQTFTYTTNAKYAFIYLLFCYFWTAELIVAIGQLVVAGSFAGWYFTREKATMMNSTVFWASRITLFYHLGTAAFGSLIIAILRTIQSILTYIQRKAKKSGNKVLVFIIAVLKCCLWCVEKFMKFINKNGYIQTAINGYSFCKACRVAFFLIMRNVLRVLGVSMVGDFVLLLGKILVPTAATFFCYLWLAYGLDQSEIPAIISPLIATFVIAYFVAAMFSEVFGMGISTILQCFICDEEMFPPEQRFADGALRTTWQKTVQSANVIAAGNSKVVPINDSAAAPEDANRVVPFNSGATSTGGLLL